MNKIFIMMPAVSIVLIMLIAGTTVSLNTGLFEAAQDASIQVQQSSQEEDRLSDGTINLPNGQETNVTEVNIDLSEVNIDVTKLAAQTFNSQFTQYEGSTKSASQIKALKSAVETSNLNNEENQILISAPEVLSSTKKYKVEFTYDLDGYIYYILVVEEREINANSIKMDLNINDDSYFDDLQLHVGDIYDVQNQNNRIVAFCSVLEGEKPQVGEKFRIESNISPEYTYEVTLYKIDESFNSDGSELLFLYFDGVTAKEAKFTPQIRRLK